MQSTVAQLHEGLQKNPRLFASHPVVNLIKIALRLASFYPVTQSQAHEAVEKALAQMYRDTKIRTLQTDMQGFCKTFINTLVGYALKKRSKETPDQLENRIMKTAYHLNWIVEKWLFEISFLPGDKANFDIQRLFTLNDAAGNNEFAQAFIYDLFYTQNYLYIMAQADALSASRTINKGFVALYKENLKKCKNIFDVKAFLNDYCLIAVNGKKKTAKRKPKKVAG